ncbi:hypothetical protein RvVAR0630_43440 [Agrobacterium vitis]|nr:hypothetical protein RvVAR0630_43440 [Agrobacterium vitis]
MVKPVPARRGLAKDDMGIGAAGTEGTYTCQSRLPRHPSRVDNRNGKAALCQTKQRIFALV